MSYLHLYGQAEIFCTWKLDLKKGEEVNDKSRLRFSVRCKHADLFI